MAVAQVAVQKAVELMAAQLDAEGSDHYTFDQDYLPALLQSQEYILSLIASNYGKRKFSERALSLLLFTKIWQTNLYGRIHMDDGAIGPFGPVWDVVGMYAEPEVIGTANIIPTSPQASSMRTTISFLRSEYPCKRMSLEQVAELNRNVFAPGNAAFATSKLRQYYFCNLGYMNSTAYPTLGWEYEIGPTTLTGKKLIAVSWLKVPSKPTALTDNMDFPPVMLNLLVAKALNFISIKQGDRTTQFAVSDKEALDLLTTIGT